MNKRFLLPSRLSGLMLAGLVLSTALEAQVTGSSQTTTDANGQKTTSATVSVNAKKPKVAKKDRAVATKDTKREIKKDAKLAPLAGKDAGLPDKALYDKALEQTKKGHFDVARLDLQTLLNTYPDSQYQMRAKLAIADSWYKEGGSAALTQAEQEYTDFITFFPNVPEAAEAQKRVGDIYFKQIDVPDRDYSKALKAQDAYRLMLKQYGDADPKLVAETKQNLREVQEILATREADLGAFYATHENWPASIARYQTVVDTYPQFSKMDDVLIGIGDAYAAESRITRNVPTCIPNIKVQCMPEGPKAKLLQTYDGKAANAYRQVVLEHAAAPHVEDAKERLAAMNLPVPTPTAEQLAASEELEGSRAQYTLTKRLAVMFLRKADTVQTARSGEPPLDDAVATVAPGVLKELTNDYKIAFGVAPDAPKSSTAAPTEGATPETPVVPAGPLALQDVAGPGGDTGGAGSVTTASPASPAGSAPGASVGVEVLTPGVTTTRQPVDTTPDPITGLHAVGPANTAALPPVEKAAPAPDQINDVEGKAQPAAQVKDPNSKKKAKSPTVDKEDESSSKKKPKKGLNKVNPF